MSQASRRVSAPAKRILVADDDPAICALLERVLGRGACVTTVADAEAALRVLASEPPYDLVITDFVLPGMDGLAFVQRIRTLPRNRRTPVLIISGNARCGLDDRARAAGADAFLDKPFSLSQLRATIVKLLDPGPSLRAIS